MNQQFLTIIKSNYFDEHNFSTMTIEFIYEKFDSNNFRFQVITVHHITIDWSTREFRTNNHPSICIQKGFNIRKLSSQPYSRQHHSELKRQLEKLNIWIATNIEWGLRFSGKQANDSRFTIDTKSLSEPA